MDIITIYYLVTYYYYSTDIRSDRKGISMAHLSFCIYNSLFHYYCTLNDFHAHANSSWYIQIPVIKSGLVMTVKALRRPMHWTPALMLWRCYKKRDIMLLYLLKSAPATALRDDEIILQWPPTTLRDIIIRMKYPRSKWRMTECVSVPSYLQTVASV